MARAMEALETFLHAKDKSLQCFGLPQSQPPGISVDLPYSPALDVVLNTQKNPNWRRCQTGIFFPAARLLQPQHHAPPVTLSPLKHHSMLVFLPKKITHKEDLYFSECQTSPADFCKALSSIFALSGQIMGFELCRFRCNGSLC